MSRDPLPSWTDGEYLSVLNLGHLRLRAGMDDDGWEIHACAQGMEGRVITGYGESRRASKLAAEDAAVAIAMGILRATGFDENALDRLDRPPSVYRKTPHIHNFVNDRCACGERDD